MLSSIPQGPALLDKFDFEEISAFGVVLLAGLGLGFFFAYKLFALVIGFLKKYREDK